MFTPKTRVQFKHVLRNLLEGEAVCEHERQSLQRRPLFNSHQAFKDIDGGKAGFVTKNQLRNVFEDHGVYTTKKELAALVDRFDKNKDGMISYSEFFQEITPKSPLKY